MPVSTLLQQICHEGSASTKLIEPAKRNNARLYLGLSNLLKVLQGQFSVDSAYLTTIANALDGDIYPLDVVFTPPPVNTEMRPIKGKYNVTCTYAGYTTFGPASCTFNNFIDADTYKFFYRWALIAGGLTINYNDTEIEVVDSVVNSVGIPLPLPDIGSGWFYRVNGRISQFYTGANITVNTGGMIGSRTNMADTDTEYNRWILQNVWPSVVSTSGFDLEGDQGSMIKTSVEFAVDLCLPSDPRGNSTSS
jgi:hypothetical protein